jgi:hypothetical protein
MVLQSLANLIDPLWINDQDPDFCVTMKMKLRNSAQNGTDSAWHGLGVQEPARATQRIPGSE